MLRACGELRLVTIDRNLHQRVKAVIKHVMGFQPSVSFIRAIMSSNFAYLPTLSPV
jgi:hypothetical protein